VHPSRVIFPNSTFGGNNSPEVDLPQIIFMQKKFHLYLSCMKIIAIQLFNISSINLVDAMIVNRIMLENKTHRALKLSAQCYKNKKHIHYFKKFKNYVINNFNLSFFKSNHILIPCWKLTIN
jgi:hypothetical protein